MRNAIAFATTFMLCACGGPMGPIAGNKLEGTLAEWPEDWSFTADRENFLLETNPEDPYSVTIWAVDVDGDLYITAVDSNSRWVQNIMQNSDVLVAVAGKLYPGRAHVVTDPNEMTPVGSRYGSKYEMSPEEGANILEEGGVIFRLSSR